MKLKVSTLILLLAALTLAGVVYLIEARRPDQPEAQTQPSIFSFAEDQVQTLKITTPKQTLVFERIEPGQASPTVEVSQGVPQLPAVNLSNWQIKQPLQAPASETAVAYLVNLLATSTVEQSLTIPAARRQEFGLANPLATVTVTLSNDLQPAFGQRTRHQLVLGKVNFNQSAVYALADPAPNASQLTVLLVPTALESAVRRPLAEWQQNSQPNQPLPDVN